MACNGMKPMMLSKLSKSIAFPLSCMFESFFVNQYVPPIWKLAYVKPILKSGDSSKTDN